MIATVTYNKFRRQVLKHEHLDDVSAFSDPGFFDEIPLYSRYRHIESFISDADSPESVLLDLAITYLEEIIGQAKPRATFLAAITVLDDTDCDQIVPNLFVCHGQVRQRLHGLRLSVPSTPFGKRLASIVRRLGRQRKFQLLEDTSTVPGHVRVFISYRTTRGRLMNIGELKGEVPRARNGKAGSHQAWRTWAEPREAGIR
ncbi:MAG: hypothetical protein ABSG86_29820 [Thermoguttaceae bacterium]|jgi:hypothetical protein